MPHPSLDKTKQPPFETNDLRSNLKTYLNEKFYDPIAGEERRLGSFRWGVYAFFDYDGEPIYVGQTAEMVSSRIGRHMTNQRTDAVAMSVLDPFEVFEIEVWPLPQFQEVTTKKSSAADYADAKAHLDALERLIFEKAIQDSQFRAILNEKDPPVPTVTVSEPPSHRSAIVSESVHAIRSHPDFRIARRALIISRLAQVISERQVTDGLRRVLLTQSKRLQWLAGRRFEALGGSTNYANGDDTGT